MKRGSAASAPPGRDVDLGSRPVETTQHEAVSRTTAIKIPRAQGVWIALPFTVAVTVTILAPIIVGPRIFYGVTALASIAAFLWSVQFEMKWQDRLSLPFLCGLIAWCTWRFTDFIGWRAPQHWQPHATLFVTGALIFWWTFTAAMWLTFWQRLGMPIYHQQYSVWKAIGELIEHWGKREKPEPEPPPEPRRVVFDFRRNDGNIRNTEPAPIDDDTLTWVCRVLQDETFSEASLCGTDKPLPGGARGRVLLDELRDWLLKWELIRWNRTNGKGEPIRTQGVSLTRNGARWIGEVGQ